MLKKFFQKNNLPFMIGFLLTIGLLWPLIAAPFFTHHDDVQVIRTHQMVKCFYDLQLPCRWVPDLGAYRDWEREDVS